MKATRHPLSQWILALRPWSLPASAMPIIVTLAYLYWKGCELNWCFGIWTLVNMILFHLAGNLWSDYNDYVKAVDREDTTGAKSMTSGMFRPDEIRNLALIVLAIAVAGGVGLVVLTGLPLLWIGIAGALLTVLYPVLKYNALGDLDILLTFSFLPTVGTSYVTTGAIEWGVLLIAVPVGLITDGILHSNNTRDVASDSRAEIRTLAMQLGKKSSAYMYAFEVLFPFIWIAGCVLAGVMPALTFITFLAAVLALRCSRTMLGSVKDSTSESIADLDMKTANLQLVFSLLLSLAFVLSKLL